MNLDLTICASEEAKICLNCDKQTCKSPANCTRFKDEIRKLKEKVNRRKEVIK